MCGRTLLSHFSVALHSMAVSSAEYMAHHAVDLEDEEDEEEEGESAPLLRSGSSRDGKSRWMNTTRCATVQGLT